MSKLLVIVLAVGIAVSQELSIGDQMDAALKALRSSQDSSKRYDDSIAALPRFDTGAPTVVPTKVVIWGHDIDSIQTKIDSINKILLSNKHYKQMLVQSYNVVDRINYFKWLRQHKFESSESISTAADRVNQVLMWEMEIIRIGMEYKKGMPRYVLFRELKKKQEALTKLSIYIYTLQETPTMKKAKLITGGE